ncbi:LPS-assembly protein LptD [Campylobacter sp. FMV-PI01]|uniref:LPS-assembly protein LptD n=1 Tax=Campylobacter portucalensis TaxID=2608384 RepID=A0A6L5WLP6_9BACT|nr:LPS assembly protein LptD [Campylobacter portucalensis]MSN96935.1 LPS-assembly protein LptD [Campylobacter portucalensis]
MNKIIFFLFLVILSLKASVQDVELLADDVKKDGSIMQASGNVVMYSKDYLVTAKKAIYDENLQVIEFFDDVNIIRNSDEISRTNYLKIDIKEKKNFATENFFMNKKSEIWMQNDESCSNETHYKTKGSIVSSCNINSPDWKISYTSGKLNKNSKFLHLYNPVFYLGDLPVLYLPYFGFPTDKTRRTGLLIPEVGYFSNDGIYYKQPIYFAPYDNWDLEFNPQVRSKRGFGIYSIFRFVDSPYSYGEIRGGIFDNFKRAQKKLEYKNEQHKGIEIQYDRSKLVKYLVDGDFKEHLWLDFKQVNDVEYFDLKNKHTHLSDSKDSLVTSRLNYYLTTDNNYFGIYTKYYIDTDKLNKKYDFKNKDTLQELPTLHYHKFLNSIFLDNLLYLFDIKYHNFTRQDGVSANQYEFYIPLMFSMPLLNDWINLKLTQGTYATHINYDDNFIYKNGKFIKNKSDYYLNHYYKFIISTDIAKAYSNFFHTMNFEASYILPSYNKGKIDKRLFKNHKYKFDKRKNKIDQNLISDINNNTYYEDNFIGELSQDFTQENLALNLNQYFFDKKGRKFLRHLIKQKYDFDDAKIGNLVNRVDFYFPNGLNIGNKFEYSFSNHRFEKIQSYASYLNSKFGASIRYTYENTKDKRQNYDKESYLMLNFNFNLPRYYKIFADYEYDLTRSYSKMWRAGLTHNRKCWNYTLVYQENLEPKTSIKLDYSKAEKNRKAYFFINFYPFGGVNYDFSKTKEYDKDIK